MITFLNNFVNTSSIEYVSHMGSDLSVINAATASFGKHATEWDDKKHPRLITYLARGMTQEEYDEFLDSTLRDIEVELRDDEYAYEYEGDDEYDDEDSGFARESLAYALRKYRNTPQHFSPFTHAVVTFRMKAPIAVHAQCAKHTVGFSMNTVSRRYVTDKPEVFLPTFRQAPKGNVKQGSGDELDWDFQPLVRDWYAQAVTQAIETYEKMVRSGVAPEQARLVLPQGVMTEWVWTGSLMAWARFYNLRTHPHAQRETSDLAYGINDTMAKLFPYSWYALTGGVGASL